MNYPIISIPALSQFTASIKGFYFAFTESIRNQKENGKKNVDRRVY